MSMIWTEFDGKSRLCQHSNTQTLSTSMKVRFILEIKISNYLLWWYFVYDFFVLKTTISLVKTTLEVTKLLRVLLANSSDSKQVVND